MGRLHKERGVGCGVIFGFGYVLVPVRPFPSAWLYLVASCTFMKSSKLLLVLCVIPNRLLSSLVFSNLNWNIGDF